MTRYNTSSNREGKTILLQPAPAEDTPSQVDRSRRCNATANRPRPSLRRRVLFPLAALLLAFLVAGVIAEIALRLCGYGRNYTNPMGSFFEPDNELGCRGKASFSGRFRRSDFDANVEHDENGFRRTEAAGATPAGPGRDVYVLGDSFVWGYGVGQRDLLTNQLQRLLDGRRIHNLGLIGAGTVQEHLIFERHVQDRLQPGDVVVLVFFGNDFGDNIGRNLRDRLHATIDCGQVRLIRPAAPSTARQWKNWLKDTSCVFNLATYCIDRFQDSRSLKNLGDRATRRLPSPEQICADTADAGPAVQVTRHYLAAIQQACAARQARLLAAYVPGQAELDEDDVTSTSDLSLPEEVACRHAFERAARDLAIDTVDLMGPMVAAKRSGRFERVTFLYDFHWNAAGHTLAAETLAVAIEGRGPKVAARPEPAR